MGAGIISGLLGRGPEDLGMSYRIRVFDNHHHIKTATVPARGQRRINLVVKPKEYFILGEEVKLSFMINPRIVPNYFGNVMEVDFDIRDSTQLADLFDLTPDLVLELNENLYNVLKALDDQKKQDDLSRQKTEGKIIEAEFEDKGSVEAGPMSPDMLDALTDPAPIPEEKVTVEKSDFRKRIDNIPGVNATVRAVDSIKGSANNLNTNMRGLQYLYEIYATKEHEEKQALMKKVLEFCMVPSNAKCLRWLPAYLNIEPEIMAIVSQTEFDGVGIMAEYYTKQSTAEISEKIFSRPKLPDDWKMMAIILIGILGSLGLVVALILKLAGKI
jgi:hypothetical protein